MRIQTPVEKLTAWQRIFSQSKANGAPYNGDALEQYNWEWPKGTYFQCRFDQSEFLSRRSVAKRESRQSAGELAEGH